MTAVVSIAALEWRDWIDPHVKPTTLHHLPTNRAILSMKRWRWAVHYR